MTSLLTCNSVLYLVLNIILSKEFYILISSIDLPFFFILYYVSFE